MSKPAKPRGLADLDALMPGPPTAKPKPATPPPARSASPARSEQTPTPRRARPTEVLRPTPASRPRVRIRSQVFYLPDEQIDNLNRLSRQTERSKSDLVREAITDYLKRTEGRR